MRPLLGYFLSIAIFLTFSGLAQNKEGMKPKEVPEHKGVAADLKPFVQDFLDLSAHNHISFPKEVTVGFKEIGRPPVIGTCTFGGEWREVDIDVEYWERASFTSQRTLIFHELIHCYCGRGHDYADGKDYNSITDWIFNAIAFKGAPWRSESPGYYDDGCPTSIMHPSIISDWCMHEHNDDYMVEMFNRCEPFE